MFAIDADFLIKAMGLISKKVRADCLIKADCVIKAVDADCLS